MRRIVLLLVLPLLLLAVVPALAQSPVVRAVLFYSPFCGHCHKVINEDIPPLSEQHNREVAWTHVAEEPGQETSDIPPLIALEGDALQILFVNTTTPIGADLFGKAIEAYEIPDPVGVPLLVIGNQYMIGSADIPAQLPGIISEGLAGEGIDWPVIPDLDQYLDQLSPFEQDTAEGPEPGGTSSESEGDGDGQAAGIEEPAGGSGASGDPAAELLMANRGELTLRERVLLDPVGNTLSILVLIGMLLSVIVVVARWYSDSGRETFAAPSAWLLPLIMLGGAVAVYLTFIETTGTEAICGPVGDCNTVQDSAYAMLFGAIPVGALGLVGYAFLLVTWILARMDRQPISNLAAIGFFALAIAGMLFSMYLTFLEPFVIGATCMWCLSSAVIMTALAIASTDSGKTAFRTLRS